MIPIEELKESSFYQHILDEGRQEGREECRQEGESSLLQTVLEHRFGLPEWVLKKIATANTDLLEQWVTRAVDAQSLEEVIDRS